MTLYMRRNAITDPVPMDKGWSKASLKRRDQRRTPSRCDHQAARLAGSVRLVVLGAAGVGKTCLITRFLHNTFTDTYTCTVEDLYWGQSCAHGLCWNLEVLDTAGAFHFPAMRRLAVDSGRVFLLVYSVDDEESFEEVRRLREEVLARRADRKTPVAVVGNKCDVEEGRRFLSAQTTDFLVNIEWGHYYVETSAKDGVNVEKAFTDVLVELVEKEESEADAFHGDTASLCGCLNWRSCLPSCYAE